MIFLDTSFLVSVEVETDQNHEKAIKVMDEIINGKFGKPVISDYIFDETVTVTFGRSRELKKAVIVGTNLQNSVEILKVAEKNIEEAWNLFKNQKVTRFSFTDCTILSLMKKEGIRNIATFDGDFRTIKEINIIC
ncbi:MAG: type II toxin-antitoxin system VapC family toxin [Candidatus Aenigmarchaeota archaeon]|nr:type II toxin-antitoxin system VapC family toxin [Candidatus Aenigmarchaeota archaeon]